MSTNKAALVAQVVQRIEDAHDLRDDLTQAFYDAERAAA